MKKWYSPAEPAKLTGEFLARLRLPPGSYFFALSTRQCFDTVPHRIQSILRQNGHRLAAFFSLEMPETYLPIFEVDSRAQQARAPEYKDKIA